MIDGVAAAVAQDLRELYGSRLVENHEQVQVRVTSRIAAGGDPIGTTALVGLLSLAGVRGTPRSCWS